MKALNFALFNLTDIIFAPRIPKPHREILWGFGSAKDYEKYLIKPTKFIGENLIEEEWDNIPKGLSLLFITDETSPSNIIGNYVPKSTPVK